MKKLVLTTLAVSGLAVAAFAQGSVEWANVGGAFLGQTNSTVTSTFSQFGGGLATGSGTVGLTVGNTAANNAALLYSGYYYELLVSSSAVAAPTTVAGLAAWSDTSLVATNGNGSNGRIVQAAAGGIAGNTDATANNWPAGTTESVILVGWSANLGSTWSAALADLTAGSGWTGNGYFGVSAMGSLPSGNANPGTIVFGGTAGQINNSPNNTPAGSDMQLDLLAQAVPEPGTLALAAIGGASLLMFRRKK